MIRQLTIAAALLLQGPAALAHHGGRYVTATVYHQEFNGGPAYCGGTYEHWGVSAAHPWLPCGTRVRVSHGGRSLVVPITDRCDCSSLDLSAGAAWRLGVPLDGIATVKINY
jgi:rare lipoprotein A